jgi:UDPglucose--hexose-1-phosphate uridylyltransferase
VPESVEFRSETKRARLHDPRRGFAAVEVESEVRRDPLTGSSARICHFALSATRPPELAEIVRATAAQCPFCPERIETVTPRFPNDLVPEGRLRRGGALIVPNLFPYDDVSAIAALCPEHFQPMDAIPPRVVVDGLTAARDFLKLAAVRFSPGTGYGIVTWNYMPPAGASQVHPHMQVVATADPGNALRRELAAAQDWLERNGRPYAASLLDAEQGGARWVGEAGGVVWLVPFAPSGLLGDAMAMFPERRNVTELTDADIAGFAEGLVRVLRGFAAHGLWSFNLCLMPDAFDPATARHRLVARLLPRFYLNPTLHISDASYMHLLLEERFAMIHPEEVAERLRRAWGAPGAS